MKSKTMKSILAGVMAVVMTFLLCFSVLPAQVRATSSSSIKKELEELKEQAEAIKEKQEALQAELDANDEETQDIVSQKHELDQQIKLIHDEITNINAQIQTYNQLIAEKQKELDAAQMEQQKLSQQYAARISAMEKNSHVSFWSVLFQSSSFSDFLSRVRMMADIAKADQAMMAELQEAADRISVAREELSLEKDGLSQQRLQLSETQSELDAKSAEATLLLDRLNDNAMELAKLQEQYEDEEAELSSDIAEKEREYTEAKRKEEAASGGGSGGGGGTGGGGSSASWGYPLPYRATITSAYGWRIHPITGKESFHNGVDLAAGQGTAIYAVRSGTVTTATYNSVLGYYVTVNHGDGFSSMSAHMTHYIVSEGDEVTKGQVIGYVGSTGWSTGPHLHFTIYYNGSTVNPMNYI